MTLDGDEFDVGASWDPRTCEHPSSDGIDTTPPGDPAKVWRCHSCDALHLADGSRVLPPEVVERWETFWKDLVTRGDGSLDIDQIKCELSDYWTCIDEVPKVYGEITGNTLSKPNYSARTVLGVHDERCPNVTNLIEEIWEALEARGDHDDLRPLPGPSIEDDASALADRLLRIEEILQSHETLHSRMYREERERLGAGE